MNNINNEQFLKAIFGDQYERVHVTSFLEDPGDIPQTRRGLCWAGGLYGNYPLLPGSNQFYTVSTFTPDQDGKARRRKGLFEGCYVIGADDVKEKLPLEQINRLPPPSIIIKSSNGSEQWLWILRIACTDRSMIDNLMDGLIAKGLAPDGVDPGMKGVTRYLRLPEGFNTKAKRIAENGGTAPQCLVTLWHPERKYDMEQLAAPFGVDLHAARSDASHGVPVDIKDHPLLQKLNVKSKLSEGRYDITCPWVDHHTDHVDNGTAVWTNENGSIGFACHHTTTCSDKTAVHLLDHIEGQNQGFKEMLRQWENMRQLASLPTGMPAPAPAPTDSFLEPAPAPPKTYEESVALLSSMVPGSDGLLTGIKNFAQVIDGLDPQIRLKWQDRVRIIGQYTKTDFTNFLKVWRKEWRSPTKISHVDECKQLFEGSYFIRSMNQVYTPAKRMFQSVEGFANGACHIDENIRSVALTEGRMVKVDKVDYVPGQPTIFEEKGIRYVNGWTEIDKTMAIKGSTAPWDEHFAVLGWTEHQEEIERRMAFTIQHPDVKINTAMVLGGHQGIGKDWIMYPLVRTMGSHSKAIQGDSLSGQFSDFLLNCKHLHINELQVGSSNEGRIIHNKLKPIIAAPPDVHSINLKGKALIEVRNIVNVTIATNDRHFLNMDHDDRRYWAIWSDLVQLDKEGNPLPGVEEKWAKLWGWMEHDGWKNVLYKLLHETNLDNFNSKALPKMTNYMSEVKEQSRDVVVRLMEELKDLRVGMLAGDLVTTDDILTAIRMDGVKANIIGKIQGPQLSKALHSFGYELSFRIRLKNGSRPTLFVIRNEAKYRGKSPKEMQVAYEEQVKMVLVNEPPTML